MLKNKKIIIIVVVLILIIAVLFTCFIYKKNKYSLEHIKQLLSSERTISNIHATLKEKDKNEEKVTDTFIKDNFVYSVVKNNISSQTIYESFYNPENSEAVTIVHSDKLILNYQKSVNENKCPNENEDFLEASKHGRFKYIGKAEIDGKKCIKVSLANEEDERTSKAYYYIDLEYNNIIKYEYYEGENKDKLEKMQEKSYIFLYNTVSDDDILKFDINDYPNYKSYK